MEKFRNMVRRLLEEGEFDRCTSYATKKAMRLLPGNEMSEEDLDRDAERGRSYIKSLEDHLQANAGQFAVPTLAFICTCQSVTILQSMLAAMACSPDEDYFGTGSGIPEYEPGKNGELTYAITVFMEVIDDLHAMSRLRAFLTVCDHPAVNDSAKYGEQCREITDRLLSMADACIDHIREIIDSMSPDEVNEYFSVDTDPIHAVELYDTMEALEKMLVGYYEDPWDTERKNVGRFIAAFRVAAAKKQNQEEKR